jgi:hypothetical protein
VRNVISPKPLIDGAQPRLETVLAISDDGLLVYGINYYVADVLQFYGKYLRVAETIIKSFQVDFSRNSHSL